MKDRSIKLNPSYKVLHKLRKGPNVGCQLPKLITGKTGLGDDTAKESLKKFLESEFPCESELPCEYAVYKYTFGRFVTTEDGFRSASSGNLRSAPESVCDPVDFETMFTVLANELSIEPSVEYEIQCRFDSGNNRWAPENRPPWRYQASKYASNDGPRFGPFDGKFVDEDSPEGLWRKYEKDWPDSILRISATSDAKQACSWALAPWPSSVATGSLFEDGTNMMTVEEIQEKCGVVGLQLTATQASNQKSIE